MTKRDATLRVLRELLASKEKELMKEKVESTRLLNQLAQYISPEAYAKMRDEKDKELARLLKVNSELGSINKELEAAIATGEKAAKEAMARLTAEGIEVKFKCCHEGKIAELEKENAILRAAKNAPSRRCANCAALTARIAKAKEAYLSVFDVRTLEMMDRITATLPSAKLLKIWKALADLPEGKMPHHSTPARPIRWR